MKKVILALAGAFSIISGAALADGMPRSDGAAACCNPSAPWTGFYIGGGIGAASITSNLSSDVLDSSVSGLGGDGIFGTVIIGFDRMLAPGIVGGIFADYDFSSISSNLNIDGVTLTGEHKSTWSVGARLGVLSSATTLWYATGGYSASKSDASFVGLSANMPDFHGYFVGGGVESQLRGNWSLRGEYRFTQMGSESIDNFIEVEPSAHSVRMALTYKWGREDATRAPIK